MDRTWMILLTTIFPLLSSTFSLSLPAQILNNETDRLALLAIKSKIDHDPFHVLNSWNHSSLSFCNWRGVTCSPRHQRVTVLNLRSQGLVGSLSPYIGNLTFLQSLVLINNTFHDEIPPHVGRLYRLKTLHLAYNSFVGEIPANISHCTNLERLRLDHNHLGGKIPVGFASLSKLFEFILERNNLSGTIPPWIGNFSSLQFFSLIGNSFQGGIPNSLGQLTRLTFLGLGVNMFSGTVPPAFYNISSLETFVLAQNQLTGSLPQNIRLPNLRNLEFGMTIFSGTIPSSLFNTSRLEIVDLGGNNFSGKVPLEVGNQKKLRIFSLNRNTGIQGLDFLKPLANCSNLQYLDISHNQIRGMLPDSITNLSSQLSQLYLGENQLQGVIPLGLQNYENLIGLGMERNFFTGKIPFTIGMLHNLQELQLGGNRLVGPIPSSLGNLSMLYLLDLTDNIFEGNILPIITKCQSLQQLYLTNNMFHGTIPEEIVNLSQLRYLSLAHNSFNGSLPIQFGNLKALQELDVSGNKLTGEIPVTIAGCWSLQSLSLRDNFFQGIIPTSLKSLHDIRSLDLSKNNLSGEIPKDLGNLTYLHYLNLSFNNLEGDVPMKGVFKNASAFSLDGNHNLCGGIVKLHLPTCHHQMSKKGNVSLALKVSLGVGIPLIVATIIVVSSLYWKKEPKEQPSSEPFMVPHLERVSYHEIHQATNGFSSSNLIGVGSFGSVYKGTLHEDGGTVAIKVLNLAELGASKSFVTECDALRKIRHRNLIKIFTICSSVDFQGNDFKALVLKFMPNGSLESFLHPNSNGQDCTKSLSLLKRLSIAIDIASALDYLHNNCDTPIVHCDLKPSNILLDEDMTAHVGDFGLAKFVSKSTRDQYENNSVSPRGTIGYIPPEYGTSTEVSTQGDVYSFGILLLEMLTGKRPTDNAFKDGLTLHDFSFMGLPLRVIDIVDPLMLLEEEDTTINLSCKRDMNEIVQDCIISIVKIGVACSLQLQSERLQINDTLMELHAVKERFLRCRET